MKALTIWQPWASLIMAGVKPYEFRRWAAPRSLWGQRIVIHAGARRIRRIEIETLIQQIQREPATTGLAAKPAEDLLWKVLERPTLFATAAGLGTVLLGEPRLATDIYRGVTDSDRLDEHVWGWPLTDIVPFEPIVPCRGFQGFWHWPQGAA